MGSRLKKSLATLMAIAMTLSLCIIPAGAEGTPIAEVTIEGVKTTYDDLLSFSNALTGKTGEIDIKLLSDIVYASVTLELSAAMNVDLDLNGYAIDRTDYSKSGAATLTVRQGASLTVRDSGGTGSIKGRNAINNYGSVTIESGTLIAAQKGAGSCVWTFSGGTITVKDGTFKTIGDTEDGPSIAATALMNQGTATVEAGTFECTHHALINEGTATVTGGTYTADKKNYAYALINSSGTMHISNVDVTAAGGAMAVNGGEVTIDSGSFTSNTYYGIWVTNSGEGASLVVNGGTYVGEKYGIYSQVDDGGIEAGDVSVTINGGSFTGNTKAAAAMKGSDEYEWAMSITGGIFNTDISTYLPEGYSCVETEGKYTVLGSAKIGDKSYGTLADAVTAAQSGDTITLQRDIELTSPVVIDKSVTIEGGGHNITGAAKSALNYRQGLFHLWNEADSPVSFTLRNAELSNLSGTSNKWSAPCGISARASNQTINLEAVTMDTTYYCVIVGVPGSEHEDVNDVELNIKDSSLTGYAAIYYRTNSTKNMIMRPILNVTGSTLLGSGYSGSGNGFSTIVYNGTRNACASIENSTLGNVFSETNADASQGVIQFNCWGAYEKDAVVTIKNSVIKTASNSAAPNVIKYTCSDNLDVGNKVIIDNLTFTRGENNGDLIRMMRNGNELLATGIDLKTVLEIAELQDATYDPAVKIIKSGDNVIIPIDTSVSENTVIPAGVTVTVSSGAVLTVDAEKTLTGEDGSKLIVNGSVSGLTSVTRTGTYDWQNENWVRDTSGDYIGDGDGRIVPPKTETETKTEGDVTTTTETTTKTNYDGSKTKEIKEEVTNEATGEKTDVTVTETVATDGSVTKEEVKVTTAPDGTKTEEKVSATVDAKTGTSTTATVKTDASGKSAAEVVIENSKDAKEVSVSADAIKTAAKADEVSMTVKTAGAAITLDAGAVAAIAANAGDKVSIAVETVKPQALPQAAQEKLKDAAVVNLSISVGNNKVSSFNGGTATVAVPFTRTDSSLVVAVFYVAADGNLTRMPGAAYDQVTKSVCFKTGHFSFYAVKEETALPYTDVRDSDWYYDAVRYVTEAKLFKGTSNTAFSPLAEMSREQMWMVLARMSGKDPASMDEARTWAMDNKISDGTNPLGNISREQLVTTLWRYAGSPKSTTDLSTFADAGSISDYAKEAMAWAVEKGILQGSDSKVMPNGNAKRCEVAAILMRYYEKVAK